jgi:hypothetical protein
MIVLIVAPGWSGRAPEQDRSPGGLPRVLGCPCVTARSWITRRFDEAKYDHSKECWWLRDHEGNLVRVMVDKAA